MLDPDISTAGAERHLLRPDTEPEDRFGLDRRRFLQLVGMGMGAGLVAGPGTSLLDLNLPGFDPSAWALGPIGPTDGILLVLGMHGGNDGLNTVVPITDGHYYDFHAPVAIPAADTLPLDANTGLNPHLAELKRFWDADQLAIVEGVGHAIDEFSHFSSMAWWMSGRTSGVPDSGWVGRWLDQYLSGSRDLYAAAEIGSALPLHMIGQQSVSTTVPVGKPSFGLAENANDRKLLDAIRALGAGDPGPPTNPNWRSRVGQAQRDQLDIAARLAPIIPTEENLPGVDIVAKLDIAARLINANLGFRVLTAHWGDFDSHAGQPQMHGARMVELNAALTQFFSRLHPAWAGRVTVMTYSEFGRTAHANDGEGTDHGSSAPQFVLGANVKGGFYGQRPRLAGLGEWDRMDTHVLTQDYYGSLIDGWLGGDAASIVPGYSENLGLFTTGPNDAPAFPGTVLGQFVALNPTRIFDSRDSTGGAAARLGPGQTLEVKIAGVNGVPANDVRAVAVNISSIRPTETTYLTAFPTGYAKPLTATLNPRAGAVVPNMSVVGVGSDGTISLFNNAGTVDVTIDLMGYFRRDVAARITPLTPARILDSREGIGARKRRVRAGGPLVLQVAGQGGVPTSGVDAVVLNLTSIRPSTNGWITAWPTGETKPVVANLSYLTGDVVPNMVMCKVGADGKINLEPSAGDLDLVADVVGCFTADGAMLSPLSPARLLDTRDGTGAAEAKLGSGKELQLQVTGRAGVPSGAKAAVLNVTGIRPDQRTFLTIYPTGETRPTAASLNPDTGKIAGNLVVAKIGSGGKVTIYNDAGSLHLTADITAYFI
jgi:uncharacterized protein (DUF1501 family)